jgi:hypothetical protein
MGFTTTWLQALGCRVILGVLEAGYYPGRVFLLSCWYVRWEVQKRSSGFYLLALLTSGFSNILAWGLSEMKGLGGMNGWQWVFAIVSFEAPSSGVNIADDNNTGRCNYCHTGYHRIHHDYQLSRSFHETLTDNEAIVPHDRRSKHHPISHPARPR